jgi:hypothetical protein
MSGLISPVNGWLIEALLALAASGLDVDAPGISKLGR